MQNNTQKNEAKYEVSPLELIFDVVIVFAISKLTDHLMSNLDLHGIAEVVVLLIVIYNVWSYTSFEATLIHVGKIKTQWMMLSVMLLGIFMNAGIENAFKENPWLFVVPFLISQIGHGIFTTFSDTDKKLRSHYFIMTGWILATTPLWIIGGLVDSKERIVWWGIAAIIDIVGTWFAHPILGRVFITDHFEFDADHMLERCRLFLIIALGETIFALADAISHNMISPIIIGTGVCAFISIISLWALYFWGSDHIVVRHLEETTNPILTARLTMNGLIIALAGLIFFAVGIKLTVANPFEQPSIIRSLFIFGGPVLYILPQGWYLWYVTGKVSYDRIFGVLVLLLSGLLTFGVRPWITLFVIMIELTVLSFAIVKSVNKSNSESSNNFVVKK